MPHPSLGKEVSLSSLGQKLSAVLVEYRNEIQRDDAKGRLAVRYPVFFMDDLDDHQKNVVIAYMEATMLSCSNSVRIKPKRRHRLQLTRPSFPARRKLVWDERERCFLVASVVPQM